MHYRHVAVGAIILIMVKGGDIGGQDGLKSPTLTVRGAKHSQKYRDMAELIDCS